MQIMTRKTGLCQPDSLGECTYYNCDGSSCEISETNEECKACNPVSDDGTCAAGIHLVGNTIYSCDHSTGCDLVTGDDIPLGYVVAYDKSYIVCKADGHCEALTLETDCGATGKSGTLFGTDADDAQLCIIPDRTSPVTAPVSTGAKYMVPYKATLIGIEALNGNDYFIAMEITGKNVKVLKGKLINY